MYCSGSSRDEAHRPDDRGLLGPSYADEMPVDGRDEVDGMTTLRGRRVASLDVWLLGRTVYSVRSFVVWFASRYVVDETGNASRGRSDARRESYES